MPEYYAHSENDCKKKHELSKHLYKTAQLAESFACEEKYKPIFKMTGLLHDFGKYQSAFQDYLKVKDLLCHIASGIDVSPRNGADRAGR